MENRRKRLGEVLMENGLIDRFQLQSALAHQKKWGQHLGETLIELGFVSENTLMKALSKFFNIPSINVDVLDADPEAIRLISLELAEKLVALPIAIKKVNQKQRLVVAMADPTNLQAVDEIQFTAGMQVLAMVSTVSGIQKAIRRYYQEDGPLSPFDAGSGMSGISMMTPKAGDSRMAVIRGGVEEVVKFDPNGKETESTESSPPQPVPEKPVPVEAEPANEFDAAIDSGLNLGEVLPGSSPATSIDPELTDDLVDDVGLEVTEMEQNLPKAEKSVDEAAVPDEALFDDSDLDALDSILAGHSLDLPEVPPEPTPEPIVEPLPEPVTTVIAEEEIEVELPPMPSDVDSEPAAVEKEKDSSLCQLVDLLASKQLIQPEEREALFQEQDPFAALGKLLLKKKILNEDEWAALKPDDREDSEEN